MWTLLNVRTGEEKTLSDWGIQNLVRRQASAQMQGVSFEIPGDGDGDSIFLSEDRVIIKKDGANWFHGVAVLAPRSMTGQAEGVSYELADPWWYLRQITYQQPWIFNAAQDSIPVSHLIFNVDASGNKLTTGQQIKAAFDWAKSGLLSDDTNPPIDLDESWLPPLDVPIDEARDQNCLEVILRMLRFSPDVVAFWDHAGPQPTLRFRSQSNLVPVSIAIRQREAEATTDYEVEGLDIVKRNDLTVPAVVIRYESVNEFDGQTLMGLTVDAWPVGQTGMKLGTPVATIQLDGYIQNDVQGTIITSPIDYTSADWWKGRLENLNHESVKNLVINNPQRGSIAPLGHELIDGDIADWMGGQTEEETITAEASYDVLHEGQDEPSKFPLAPISIKLKATDLASGLYRKVADFTPGEPVPIGLAKFLYDAANAVAFDGGLTITETECSGLVTMGNCVNVTNGRAEWATMNALVQQIVENIDRGQTVITIGPRKHLERDDIMAILRFNRTRVHLTSISQRTTGRASGQKIVLAEKTPRQTVTSGSPKIDNLIVADKVQIRKTDFLKDPRGNILGNTIRIREMSVCVKNADGTHREGFVQVPCTEVYFK